MPEAIGRVVVRPYAAGDAGAVWGILEAVIAGGDTFAFAPEMPREEALAAWLSGSCSVACAEGRVLGSYLLRANQPGLGAHVANASFMVDPAARGRGIGRLLGEHALARAVDEGFRAMQFNLVVAENDGAIALWRSLGFAVVGRLPGAFHWRRERYADALVMYRSLVEGAGAAATL